MRYRIAFTSVLAINLAACGDPASLIGPDDSPSLKRAGTTAVAEKQLLVSGLEELQGSAVGPGGDLFVTAPRTGSIWRVDPKTGARTLFASGLPPRIRGVGEEDLFYIGAGVVDVAFIGSTAYALVTGVGEDIGGSEVVGIYRIDGPSSSTVIADIGAWSIANPPIPAFVVPTGWQYAIEPYRGGFLVTDGHLNRVLWVSLDGEITEVIAFDNLVPTGLAVWGNQIFLAQAGPIPHVPETGRVVRFGLGSSTATEVASGIRLAVDVEFGRGRTLFALSQGLWEGPFEGAPAIPNTGALIRVHTDGTLATVVDGLNQPTSLEIIGNTAYVVTLGGEVWTVSDIAAPPYGR